MRIARRPDIAGSLRVVSCAQLDEDEPVGGTTFKLRGWSPPADVWHSVSEPARGGRRG